MEVKSAGKTHFQPAVFTDCLLCGSKDMGSPFNLTVKAGSAMVSILQISKINTQKTIRLDHNLTTAALWGLSKLTPQPVLQRTTYF